MRDSAVRICYRATVTQFFFSGLDTRDKGVVVCFVLFPTCHYTAFVIADHLNPLYPHHVEPHSRTYSTIAIRQLDGPSNSGASIPGSLGGRMGGRWGTKKQLLFPLRGETPVSVIFPKTINGGLPCDTGAVARHSFLLIKSLTTASAFYHLWAPSRGEDDKTRHLCEHHEEAERDLRCETVQSEYVTVLP